MSKSPYIRYDKSAGLWIQHRKVVYLYWFKFLQHAERDDRYDVDWSQYKSWGGREVVMETKFDVWWKEHWSDLLGSQRTTRDRTVPYSINATSR